MNIKLTAAVPVYNVEKYLRKCIDSLIVNKIDHYEILLVDDGSTDNSGNICDEYATKYDFIRVIHQENKGLAEVRNVCVKYAKGEYISFIDSDDFLAENAYAHLMELVENYDADILCYGIYDLYEGTETTREFINKEKEEISVLTSQSALEEMLLPYHVDVITCNKIIKTVLYDNIKYPSGKLYEDMFTNYKVVSKAKKIVSTNYKYYCYYHRNGSIGRMKFNPKTMDLAVAVNEVYQFGKDYCGNKIDNLEVGKLFWEIVVINSMIKSDTFDYSFVHSTQRFGKSIIKKIVNNQCLNRTRKIQMLIFCYSFKVYKNVYKKYVKINR